ncbi:MAG: hypothetical protein IK081_05445 [Lachnospiraceae bacterium]|nr:hypothetical protein [Lachnospiraceae bacterium]
MGKKEEEEKKDRAALLLERKKITFNLVLLLAASFVVLIGVLTMAWFAKNTMVKGNGPGISAKDGKGYTISFLENSTNGIFSDYYDAIREETDPSVLVMGMTADSNLDNYESTDEGIVPGASGKMSFYLTPTGNPVDLKFEIEIVGYVSSVTDDEITMTELDDGDLKDHLNGHVFLFEEYDETTETYAKPILPDANSKRVFTREFDSQELVNIYWVWPEHLSNLVNAYNGTTITAHTLVDDQGDDYDDIVENVCAYPTYYFRSESAGATLNNLTETKLTSEYVTYGSLYDAADNDIGTGVDYILFRMKVTVNEE